MRCVILQPSYIPWRGYFDLIRRAGVFVFYDDVQYDTRGWRNRNRVKTPRGAQWLTIPFNRPCVCGRELEYVRDAIDNGHISGDGAYTRRAHAMLEQLFGGARVLL